MTFIIKEGLYYNKFMPFWVKNARATYHRLVDQMFREQKGKNV